MPSLCCWWCSSFAAGLLRDVHQGSAGNPPKLPTVVFCYLFRQRLAEPGVCWLGKALLFSIPGKGLFRVKEDIAPRRGLLLQSVARDIESEVLPSLNLGLCRYCVWLCAQLMSANSITISNSVDGASGLDIDPQKRFNNSVFAI